MEGLSMRIKELEAIEASQMFELKAQAAVVAESLRPSELAKSVIQEITGSADLKHAAVDTSVGLAAGWLAQKIFTLNSPNAIRRMLGFGLQYITTNIITKKMSGLRDQSEEF